MRRRMNLSFLILSVGLSLCSCQPRESNSDKVEEREKRTGMEVVEKPWPAWAVTFSADGHWLAAGRGYQSNTKGWLGGKGEVNVWKVEDWKLQDGFSAPFTTYVQALAFTSNGKHLVAAATKYIQTDPKTGGPVVGTPNPYDGNVVFVWTVPDGSLEQSHHFNDFRSIPNRGAGFVCSLDIHPDAELVALSRTGSVSVVLQRKTGRLVYDVKWDSGTSHSLAFSPNGKFLVSLGYRTPFVQPYEAATGKELPRFDLKRGEPVSVCYSPDGRQLAVGMTDGVVLLLAGDLTKKLRSLEVSAKNEKVETLAYAANSDLLAAATTTKVRLFEASTGKQVQEWDKEKLRVRQSLCRRMASFWPSATAENMSLRASSGAASSTFGTQQQADS